MLAIIPITPQVSKKQTAFSQRILIRAPDNGGKPSKLTNFSALYLRDEFRIRAVRRLSLSANLIGNRDLFVLFLVIDF